MRRLVIKGDQVRDELHPTEPLWCWCRTRPCETNCVAYSRVHGTGCPDRAVCIAMPPGQALGEIAEEHR